MLYSEFGKREVVCKHCKKETFGFLWHGKWNHYLAVCCIHCRHHTTHWLVKRDPLCERANILIDHWEVFQLPGQTPKGDFGASFTEPSQTLFDDQ